ncbi:sulfate adenylyltransferase [Mycobacterium paraseoulense]|uniref:sulfate adenylyltransferase n=1 Tax=Mycobacterium paraseoulense TaxID=590652 RepID=A0A1X0I9X2_9MYCO|nr:sulfate adenylyltransferase [Mycobacterium paraseoulense]MCV7395069.1 sulfate adenylyltransferase [Mycobacterium paraseoulense]ORB39125.1 sulfate adenylyltransferase [Mycobacterium paraseoulense]BBZ71447.1 sulfate adenylyltransferase [Mycobacterium paraseoulense]
MNYKGHNGNPIVERISTENAAGQIQGMPRIPISKATAHEVISLSYGFFTPLTGFMGRQEVDGTLDNMQLPDGTLWSIPIVFDMSADEIARLNIKVGDRVVLEYLDAPMAIFDISEIYEYDLARMAEKTYGTSDPRHPGVKKTLAYQNRFIGGDITLINEPVFNEPFKSFWLTPKQHMEALAERDWKHAVAHQTRNVPHTGHEALMKQAWLAANEDMPVDNLNTGVLVNAIIGQKRVGDYIDEAILLAQNALRTSGYFRDNVHMVSFTLWDMRYAGPREAIFHAILRTNLGCTHHMFGRDHAGVGDFYHPYDAQNLLKQHRTELGIKPVFLRENWYCPECLEVTNSALCGHDSKAQSFSGSLIRSILTDEVKPTQKVMRHEVFEVVMESAAKYGEGSPFVTEEYLKTRRPVFTLKQLEES